MDRKFQPGDMVKITPNIGSLRAMDCGWVSEIDKWAGRLAVVCSFHTSPDVVVVRASDIDTALGIIPSSECWAFDVDLVEKVEMEELNDAVL